MLVQLEAVITRVHHLCAKPWTLLHFWSRLSHTVCSIGLPLALNFLQEAFFSSSSLESCLLPCTYSFGNVTLDSLDHDGLLSTLRASPCYLIPSCLTHSRTSVNTCGMTERRKTESQQFAWLQKEVQKKKQEKLRTRKHVLWCWFSDSHLSDKWINKWVEQNDSEWGGFMFLVSTLLCPVLSR